MTGTPHRGRQWFDVEASVAAAVKRANRRVRDGCRRDVEELTAGLATGGGDIDDDEIFERQYARHEHIWRLL